MTASVRPHVALLPVVIAAAVGLAVGVATSYLQGVLASSWSTFANSGAVWTVVAFAAALACAHTRTLAVIGGGLALVGEVVGFYAIASPLRGIPSAEPERLLWTLAALVIGPLAGAAAYAWRRGRAAERVAGALGLAGVVAGEGVYALRLLPGHATTGRVEMSAAAALALVAIARVRPTAPAVLGSLLLGLGVAGAVYIAYADPLLF